MIYQETHSANCTYYVTTVSENERKGENDSFTVEFCALEKWQLVQVLC